MATSKPANPHNLANSVQQQSPVIHPIQHAKAVAENF
uniref:Uncharacterized protein n=1 Tax=Arundo donax TaxID=35708 RepID=A0A0A9DEJ6_ARUDO